MSCSAAWAPQAPLRLEQRAAANIEVAHVYWDDTAAHQAHAVAHSVAAARRFVAAEGLPPDLVSVSVLVDDQHGGGRGRDGARLLDALGGLLPVDFVCYETSLAAGFPALLALLDDPEPVERAVRERYGGRLQCSHYIAVWHALRLGLIDCPGVAIPWSAAARAGARPFVAERVVSALGARYRAPEEQALRRMLKRSAVCRPELHRIVRLYYPDPE